MITLTDVFFSAKLRGDSVFRRRVHKISWKFYSLCFHEYVVFKGTRTQSHEDFLLRNTREMRNSLVFLNNTVNEKARMDNHVFERAALTGSCLPEAQVWNLRVGACARSLLGHVGPVWAVAIRGDVMVSASQDKTVSDNQLQ